MRAIICQIPNLNVDAGRERELSAELARRSGRRFEGMAIPLAIFRRPVRHEERVLTTAAPGGGPGSNIIATDHMGAQFIDILRARMVVRQLGATVLNDLRGNVDIPRLKASGTAGWVAENAAISAADHQFEKAQLTPKHVGALAEFSRNMLLQSSPDIEALVRSDFADILAQAVDQAAINGGGSNEPDGILQTSGVDTSVSMSSGPTWATVLQLIETVETANSMGSAFATNPSAVRKMRSTAKVSSTDSVMIMEAPAMLAGFPLASTTNVPSTLTDGASPETLDRSALIFGNWADLLIGYWSVFDLLVNPYEIDRIFEGQRPSARHAHHGRDSAPRGVLRSGDRHGDRLMAETATLKRRAAHIELRVAGRRLEGYAATYGTEARIADFTETIAPGAFAAALDTERGRISSPLSTTT